MIGLGLPCPTERALEVCGLEARSPVGELVPAALGRFAAGTQYSGGAGGDEFDVSRRPGVLVLSETAGVVEEAAESALLVSPLDIEGTAQAMADGLDMPLPERAVRLAYFRDRITRWTASDWLAAQLTDLGLGTASFDTVGSTRDTVGDTCQTRVDDRANDASES